MLTPTENAPEVIEQKERFAPYVVGGAMVVVLLLGGIGAWAATTEISGAVIAGGTVVVETNTKKVQHPTGGIVSEIRVKDGDRVEGGDILMRLDQTVSQANLQIVNKQLDELAGRQARLKAERDGAERFEVPQLLSGREDEPGVADILEGERSLIASRLATIQGQRAQLRKQVAQLEEEIAGIAAQVDAKSREINLIAKELEGLEVLEAKRLVPTTKMMSLRREAARLDGELGQLRAAGATASGKIAEIELQILQIDQQHKTEIVKELREIQTKEAELMERRVAALDQQKRVEIRAPKAGFVHQLAVHTIGGVVNPAEPIMLIVPGTDNLVVEARIAPEHIDQVRGGQTAFVRLTAFDQRTTPELDGIVKRVDADLTEDPHSGTSYFGVRIAIPDKQKRRLGGGTLVPGMPAEVHIKTADRTALAYLLKPFEDQVARAFRER
jgi:membrane fusion protein, type I secretion system